MSGLIHHLSISQSLVFLINSRLGYFSAAILRWHPFSRSYGVILPSSLTMNHSSALGFSPRLPVSVYGTGRSYLELSGFSWKFAWGRYHREPKFLVYYRTSARGADLPTPFDAFALQRTIPSVRGPYAPSSPHRSIYGYRNINRFSIGYASRLFLRSRLTLF